MQSQDLSQTTPQHHTLTSIHDTLNKIHQLLNINPSLQTQPQFQLNFKAINQIKLSLRKIYNQLLVNSSPIQKIPSDSDKSSLFPEVGKREAYEQIQDLLQREENKNRCLLRKEFEFKEFQTSILEDLNDEKAVNRKLSHQINQLQDELQQKTLEIMHLKNQARAYQRGNRELLNQQKSEILTSRGYNVSSLGQAYVFNEQSREDKKLATSRQKQYNKLNPKKAREMKQKALYALYNNHKKSHYETISVHPNHEKTRKVSTTQKGTGKKQMMKELNSIDYSGKKMHGRRKSEEFIKRTPSQREGRESKQNKRKKEDLIERLEF